MAIDGSGCMHASASALSGHEVAALKRGGVHTVTVSLVIGKCPTSGYAWAALVSVDGEIAVWGGLNDGDVAQFISDVVDKVRAQWKDVAIWMSVDTSGAIVVPCPPPRH